MKEALLIYQKNLHITNENNERITYSTLIVEIENMKPIAYFHQNGQTELLKEGDVKNIFGSDYKIVGTVRSSPKKYIEKYCSSFTNINTKYYKKAS